MKLPAPRPGLALLIALVITAAFAASASAASSGPKLSVKKARSITAKKARSFQRELVPDGATASRAGQCERRSAHRVYCIAVVTGYDAELEWDWTCVTEVRVKRVRKRNARGSRVRIGYGLSACG